MEVVWHYDLTSDPIQVKPALHFWDVDLDDIIYEKKTVFLCLQNVSEPNDITINV